MSVNRRRAVVETAIPAVDINKRIMKQAVPANRGGVGAFHGPRVPLVRAAFLLPDGLRLCLRLRHSPRVQPIHDQCSARRPCLPAGYALGIAASSDDGKTHCPLSR
jgi:hypothetical protein